ncbi:hypothetical protein G9A89_001178 [Geosiphon pyriformis]|nr:hypothetical protein G9A89_001178 [Geosiphon pyriformis]
MGRAATKPDRGALPSNVKDLYIYWFKIPFWMFKISSCESIGENARRFLLSHRCIVFGLPVTFVWDGNVWRYVKRDDVCDLVIRQCDANSNSKDRLKHTEPEMLALADLTTFSGVQWYTSAHCNDFILRAPEYVGNHIEESRIELLNAQ